MDLWIRSQNKTQLIKVKNVYLDNQFVDIFYICEDGILLGKYKKKERALEVLDEIQNALLNKWSNNVKYEEHYDNENPRSLVYEMPID